MGKIVVIGSSNTDMVVNTPKIPFPGETILGGDFSVIQGGKGANQAVAAARAGGNVSFIAKVGNDDFGKQAIEGYTKDNIDTSHILVDKDKSTGIAMIIVDDVTGQNTIVVASGANGNLLPNDISKIEQEIAQADVVLLQLEIPIKTVRTAAEIAKKHKVRTILNPAPAQPLDDELLRLIDIIIPNEPETFTLVDIVPESDEDLKTATQALLEKVNEAALITLGSRGVYYMHKNGTSGLIPSVKVKAEDTTAAGDIFNGYFATMLAKDIAFEEAISIANKAAALSVTKKGAQPSIPYIKEIDI